MAEKKVRAHLYIAGRVQGVFYRAWTLKQAESLGLVGWVKNLDNARVEAIFEGSEKKVKEMVSRCKKGPKLAKPTHLDVSWEKATGEFEKFEIMA